MYQPVHAKAIIDAGVLPDIDLSVFGALGSVPQPDKNSLAFTLKAPSGAAILCGGYQAFWPGVGELWAIGSIHVERYRYKRDILIGAKWLVAFLFKSLSLKRLQAHTLLGDERSGRLLKHLGFDVSHCAAFYAPGGRHATCYARFAS